jgi:hypothetical protein
MDGLSATWICWPTTGTSSGRKIAIKSGKRKETGMEGMKRYIGTYTIRAKPMSRGEYNTLRGWSGGPPDDSPGYLTQFDGEKNSDWMHADTFEREYCSIDGNKMDFRDALLLLKSGRKVAREAWGRKTCLRLHKQEKTGELSHFIIETASGNAVGWILSNGDLLADDWFVVNETD